MHKKTTLPETSAEQPRKEPTVLPMKARVVEGKLAKESGPVLSKRQLAEVESKKVKAKKFEQTSLNDLNGFVGVCLIDAKTGFVIMKSKSKTPYIKSNTFNSEVLCKKIEAVTALGKEDGLEDILITLASEYHLVRKIQSTSDLYFYLVLDRKASNLGLAKLTLQTVEGSVSL